nr:unnamed protein product [Callosobruchus chinensis]
MLYRSAGVVCVKKIQARQEERITTKISEKTFDKRYVSKIYATLNDIEQKLILKLFSTLRDRVVRSFQVLQLNYRIPSTLCEHIDPQIKDELIEIDSTDSETDLDSIEIERDSTNTIMTTGMTAIEFFNLASKILPHEYDGSPDRLQSFLDAHTLLTARDLIGDNDSIQDIAQKLRQGIKTESSQGVTSKILGHKQFKKYKTKYAEEIKTLSVKLKRAHISEGVPAAVAEIYVLVVRALSTSASSDRAKLIMEAGAFNSTQEAVTKFVAISIEDSANDPTILYTTRQNNRTFFRHSFRDRGHNYYGQNRRFQHDGHYNNVNT